MHFSDDLLHAGMIKVVGVVVLSAFLLGESSIFTVRYREHPQVSHCCPYF